MHDVVITGIGLRTAIADTFQDLQAALREVRSGVTGETGPSGLRAVARVHADIESGWNRRDLLTLDRHVLMALLAAQDAMKAAGLTEEATRKSAHAGVILGNACGATVSVNAAFHKLYQTEPLPPYTLLRCLNSAAAAQLAIRWGLRAFCHTLSAECASSALAIHQAAQAIARGEADFVVTGGAEAPLGEGLYSAWEAMKMGAMTPPDKADPSRSCKPFARGRTGFVLGEGAAILILESERHAQARGATILGRLLGSGQSSDAYHAVMPQEEGQVAALRGALRSAGIAPGDVGYVNAHGTATAVGDVTETRSLRTVFGNAAAHVSVSSTKALHGHLIGAAGAIEAAVTLAALCGSFLPATANLEEPDPECDLDYVPLVSREAPDLSVAMSNSFGFGGTNTCLVFARA